MTMEEDDQSISVLALHYYNSNAICLESIFTQDQVNYRLLGNLPISVFGILTNLINIVVFLHADMRRNLVNLFLFAISLTDLLLLIFNFFFLLFPVIALLSKSSMLHDIYPIVLRYVMRARFFVFDLIYCFYDVFPRVPTGNTVSERNKKTTWQTPRRWNELVMEKLGKKWKRSARDRSESLCSVCDHAPMKSMLSQS